MPDHWTGEEAGFETRVAVVPGNAAKDKFVIADGVQDCNEFTHLKIV